MAQRNSPLRLRFAEGELTVSAITQDVGEARESLPAPFTRRRAGDRLQRRVPARRARVGRLGHDQVQADQPAAARRARGRHRRLRVPDHADPARRLIVTRSVTLRQYRSYASLDLALAPGVVLVVGRNGVGKTNLLESLHVATQGFSPRTRQDAQLIRFGETAARGRASRARAPASPVERAVTLRQGQAKEARLNGARLPSAESLRRELATLVFTPDRLTVVKGGPAARRAYFDRVLGRLLPGARRRCRRSTSPRSRSGTPRCAASSSALSDRDALEPWTERVADARARRSSSCAARDARAARARPSPSAPTSSGSPAARLGYDAEPPTVGRRSRARLARDLERGSDRRSARTSTTS